MLPILNYTTGGYELLGQARTVQAAKRILMKVLSSESLALIKNCGFDLFVWERTELSIELNGGPRGFVFSIGKNCGKKTTPGAVARLVPPHMDKHWSFQIANRLPEHDVAVRLAMAEPEVNKASPFLQGLSADWLMVEFWTREIEAVNAAAQRLATACSVELKEGNFTRADLGFE